MRITTSETTVLQMTKRGRNTPLFVSILLTIFFITAAGCRNIGSVSKTDDGGEYAFFQSGTLGDSAGAVIRGQLDYSQDAFVHKRGNSVKSVSASESRLSSVTRPSTSYSGFSLSDNEKEKNKEEEDAGTMEEKTDSHLSSPIQGQETASDTNSDFADFEDGDLLGDFPESEPLRTAAVTGRSMPASGTVGSTVPSRLSDSGPEYTFDEFNSFGELPELSAASDAAPPQTEPPVEDPPFLSDGAESNLLDSQISDVSTPSETGLGAAAPRVSGNSVSFAQADSAQVSAPAAAQPAEYDYSDFADLDTFDSSSGVKSTTLSDTAESAPPGEAAFPEFAKNAYDALEPSDAELSAVVNTSSRQPERERKSISEKEKAEEELKAEYAAWLEKQKAGRKEKEKAPRYLQPLEDDRAVFNGPDSPYSRDRESVPDQEHSFVREISAADLNLMSNVSSNRELMDWEKEQDMPVDWSKYSASTLYNKWRDYLGMGPNEKEALAIMKKATQAMMEYEKDGNVKKLREAGELFEKAGKKWPDSVLEEDALFYAAECYFFDKNYTKAKTSYKALLTKYSNSVLRRDAMERLYCIGVYWVKCAEEDPEVIGRFEGRQRPRFSDFAGAKDAFETIFTSDVSDKGRGPDAVFALANAYMRRGVEQGDASFDEAAKYYQRLYEFYPACKYADKAYQLAMLALYQSYRGPLYDSTPLKKAEEIAKAAQRAHKGDADVIAEQLRLIKEKQAEYLLVRGEYYEKKKIYASARSYYNQLVTEYPESEYAAKAAERYTAIRENPAESDQFALVRPIVPFLPESKNQYFEDEPSDLINDAAMVQGKVQKKDGLIYPDFSELEKTAEAGKDGDGKKEVR